MLDIIELDKAIDDEETVTLQITVKKSMLPGFRMVFEGMLSVNDQLSYKIRMAENKVMKQRAIDRQEVDERFNRMKDEIRAIYLKHLEIVGNTREAFKLTRLDYDKDYDWLVRKVQNEFTIKRDFEIMRLHHKGLPSHKIAEKVKISAVTVRKTIIREREY